MNDDSQDNDTVETARSSLKGKGSFWVSRQAIDLLLKNKATATEICAFLVLAKHSDESGQFSSAGMQAIYRAIGIGHSIAERAVARLCAMQTQTPEQHPKYNKLKNALLFPADQYAEKAGEALPHGPVARAAVRWVINDFGAGPESRVWISNELVAGVGKFAQPLKRLKRCGDVAARLLLICYSAHDMDQFGGLVPAKGFGWKYDTTKVMTGVAHGRYDLWHGNFVHSEAWNSASLPALGIASFPIDEDKKNEAISPFWRALEALDSSGFIYQVVTVMDRAPGDMDAQVIYELDTKSKHGYKPQGEFGLGGETAKLSGLLGHPVADSAGRLYGRYAAIVPSGVPVFIVGICRIRFRVSNPKNHGVRGAWARIYGGQREAKEWIDDANEVCDFVGESREDSYEECPF